MSAKVKVVSTWTCQDCDATGVTFASCERHAEGECHVVWFKGRPTAKEKP